MFTGHKAAVLDLEFSPFNDQLLATVSEDCYGKIWQVPSGDFNTPIEKEVQLLKGHQRKVGYVAWNPTADNVIATGSADFLVKIWDVTTGEEKISYSGHGGVINSINWNYDGSTLCTFAKDKKVRLFDPRNPGTAAEGNGHVGVKGGRALWLGKHDAIFTVGFGSTSERQYYIYDPKNLSTPLIGPVNIDNSAGVLMPFYDEDSDIVFLAGKGDGNIRYYEIELHNTGEITGKPEVHFLSQYASNEPTAAVGMMPKRGCDASTNEIVKLFRVVGTKLEPLSFKVPRKSDLFQEDIFPDCRSDEPTVTVEKWFAGESGKPILKSLQGGFKARVGGETTFSKRDENEPDLHHGDLAKENAELKKKIAQLEAENHKLHEQLAEKQQ